MEKTRCVHRFWLHDAPRSLATISAKSRPDLRWAGPHPPTTSEAGSTALKLVATALLTVIPLLSSCQYLKDRGSDLLDPLRLSVGAGTIAGLRARALGVLDTGLMTGDKPHLSALGLNYGTLLYFDHSDTLVDIDKAEIIQTTSIVDIDYEDGQYRSSRDSIAVLPALFSWIDVTPAVAQGDIPEGDVHNLYWLWSGKATEYDHYAQMHIFDVEAELGFVAYLGAGVSPGEIVDFVFGLVTIDLSGDDGR